MVYFGNLIIHIYNGFVIGQLGSVMNRFEH